MKNIIRKSFILVLISTVIISCGKFDNVVSYSPYIPDKENTGVLIIDVQKIALPGHESFYGKDLPYIDKIDASFEFGNIKRLATLADSYELNTILTYEMSDQGDYALPDKLEELMPEATKRFVKTYFDLTRHDEIVNAIEETGIKKWIIAGAFTDVCILQGVTGLIKKGYDIYLIEDAIYTDNTNPEPTKLRIEQSGANIIKYEDVEGAFYNNKAIKIHHSICRNEEPSSIDVTETAFVIVDYFTERINESSDIFKIEKQYRINKLFKDAEIYNSPLFLINNSTNTLIDDSVYIPEMAIRITDGFNENKVEELVGRLRDKDISKVILAGVSTEGNVPKGAIELIKQGFEVFYTCDAILASKEYESQNINYFNKGLIPLNMSSIFMEVLATYEYTDWLKLEWWNRLMQVYGDPGSAFAANTMPPIIKN